MAVPVTRGAVTTCFAAVVVVSLTACGASSSTPTRGSSRNSTAVSPSRTPAQRSTSASASRSNPPQVVRTSRRISHLTGELGRHGYSVAALDLTTGVAVRLGATSGMTEGSIAKLDIAETLYLRHQRSGAPISSETHEQLTAMIEHSDNDAANDLWVDIGERHGVGAANRILGLHSTMLGTGIYWGLSTTNATDQLTLLHNLVAAHGPLTHVSRDAILDLMHHVESDQRWGVGAAADPHTRFANKNGWLANASDDDRWLVNSLGVLTVHGDQVLMAVLTQHGPSYDGGVDLTNKIARAVRTVLLE